MDRLDRAWLIINSASGGNSPAALDELHRCLAQHRIRVERTTGFPDEKLPTPEALDAATVPLVIVYTGDGTLNAVMTVLTGWGGAVLVLPGGTTNLLSKALHGQRSLPEILTDWPRMKRIRRSCIRSEAGTALIEILAGPGAKWSDVREGLRDGDVAAVASTAVEAAQASTGDAKVVLLRPDIGRREGYSGVRLTPTADGIAIEGYGAATIADYLAQGVALLRRDFRSGPHDKLGCHPCLHCASTDGSAIELMLDGERHCGPAQLQFSLAELEVDLLTTGHG